MIAKMLHRVLFCLKSVSDIVDGLAMLGVDGTVSRDVGLKKPRILLSLFVFSTRRIRLKRWLTHSSKSLRKEVKTASTCLSWNRTNQEGLYRLVEDFRVNGHK